MIMFWGAPAAWTTDPSPGIGQPHHEPRKPRVLRLRLIASATYAKLRGPSGQLSVTWQRQVNRPNC